MKKPKDRSERALLLGKAAQHVRSVEEIIESCEIDNEKTDEAALTLLVEIENAIIALGVHS